MGGKMGNEAIIMLAVGDLIFDMPDAESFLELSVSTLRTANVTVGHGEVVYTDRAVNNYTEVPAPPSDPKNMSAFKYGGFDVITLVGNHIWDSGPPGIEDTIKVLDD